MNGRPRHSPQEEPSVTATYFIAFVALIVVVLPTLLNSCIGAAPLTHLVR